MQQAFDLEKFFPAFKNILIIFSFLFFLGYWIYTFFLLYHLSRFGIGTFPKKIALIFLVGSGTLFFISIFTLWAFAG